MQSLELALIGNGAIGLLVDAEGTIVWGCLPRFDADPTFCALLDDPPAGQERGMFAIDMIGKVKTEQSYVRNTAVLTTRVYDDKGAAILDYMAESPFMGRLPVFIGDDLTDEFGFAAVCRIGGWAVKVGPGPTHANYRLSGVMAVRQWLLSFSEHRSPSVERKH